MPAHSTITGTSRIPRPVPAATSRVTLLCLCLLIPALAYGAADSIESEAFPRLSLNGFGSLGLTRSSSDQAEFVRDLSQPDGSAGNWVGSVDSMVGLQGGVQFADNLEGVIQGVSRYRHDGSYQPELSWAFLKLSPAPNLSLRGGRLGTEFYMLADSRLVGYSSLTVRPPGDFFGGLPFYGIDGVDAQLTVPALDGLLRGKVFTGLSRENLPLGSLTWDVGGSRMSGGHLDYFEGAWQWRVGYAQIRFKQELPLNTLFRQLDFFGFSDVSQALGVAGKLSHYLSLGAVYDQGPWQVHMMLSQTRQESTSFESGRAGYLLAGYRSGEFTPYAGYSWWKTSAKSLNRTPPGLLGATVAAAMADSHSDQSTLILGMRWDFHPGLAFKAQWDRVRGSPSSKFPYRHDGAGWDGDTDVLSLSLDFVF